MATEYHNIADHGAHVGIQIAKVQGSVTQDNRRTHETTDDEIRQLLMAHIADLRRALTTARDCHQLTATASDEALKELETVTVEVNTTVSGNSRGLLESLKRIRRLAGDSLTVIAQLATIISFVKGLR